jgi:hypothetical protein
MVLCSLSTLVHLHVHPEQCSLYFLPLHFEIGEIFVSSAPDYACTTYIRGWQTPAPRAFQSGPQALQCFIIASGPSHHSWCNIFCNWFSLYILHYMHYQLWMYQFLFLFYYVFFIHRHRFLITGTGTQIYTKYIVSCIAEHVNAGCVSCREAERADRWALWLVGI